MGTTLTASEIEQAREFLTKICPQLFAEERPFYAGVPGVRVLSCFPDDPASGGWIEVDGKIDDGPGCLNYVSPGGAFRRLGCVESPMLRESTVQISGAPRSHIECFAESIRNKRRESEKPKPWTLETIPPLNQIELRRKPEHHRDTDPLKATVKLANTFGAFVPGFVGYADLLEQYEARINGGPWQICGVQP